MKWLRFVGVVSAFSLAAACSSSRSASDADAGTSTLDGAVDSDDASNPNDDGAISPVDAGDGGANVPPDARTTYVCGDARLDPGEQCDDGNVRAGDGCTGDCRREPFCGDGQVNGAERCDDGNRRSGDGCRSDCMSDETCGNGVVDTVFGEACDDGNPRDGDGCSRACELESCGNGAVDPGETCDDGNRSAFDGCGADCRREPAFVLDSLAFGGEGVGCDFSGDGAVDNRLAQALGAFLTLLNEMFVDDAIQSGDLRLLLALQGLDDMTGRDDADLSVVWLEGLDADDDPGNDLSGMGSFFGSRASFDGDGTPTSSFASRIAARELTGGPEDIDVPITFLPLELRGSVLRARVAEGLAALEQGVLCGAVPLRTLAVLPNLFELFLGGGGEPRPPCDDSGTAPTLADLVVGGYSLFLPATRPDVDVDADGLESFVLDSSGPTGCQPVIVACIDGDGTRHEGRDCVLSAVDARRRPAFADGLSASLEFTGRTARLLGIADAP